jgi:hypothetical protein
MASPQLVFLFCFVILACSLSRHGHLLLTLSPPLSAMAARSKLPPAHRLGLSDDDRNRTKKITKDRTKEAALTLSYSSSADAMKAGVGETGGGFFFVSSYSHLAYLDSGGVHF